MTPECHGADLDLPRLGPRHGRADCGGGDLSADGGARLLRQAERLTGILRPCAPGSTDQRPPDLTEHAVEPRLAQRVDGLALGDEDRNDPDDRRPDPRLATVGATADPTGPTRQRPRDRGQARAGSGTRHRLELTPVGADDDSRSTEITGRTHDVERLVGTLVLPAHSRPPERIVLARDATDAPIPGHQLGRSFPAYSRSSGSLPRPLFRGAHRLWARPRPWDRAGGAGAVRHRKRLGAPIRQARPAVTLVLRADRGSCREESLRWGEDPGGDDVLGWARNPRLVPARAAASRAALSDPGDRGPRTAGGGPGRAPGPGTEPAVGGPVARDRGATDSAARRRGSVRSRREGGPDQGAAVAPGRRWDRRPDEAGRSGPAVRPVTRLRAAGGVAPAGRGGSGVGRGAGSDDPVEAVGARGAGPGHGAEGGAAAAAAAVARSPPRRSGPAGAREPGAVPVADAARRN